MNNHKKYWFKRKRYGYGWTPVTIHGWLVVAIFLLIVILGAILISDTPKGEFTLEVGFFLLSVLITTMIMVKITMDNGPSPKWRWGKKPEDNPDEDW